MLFHKSLGLPELSYLEGYYLLEPTRHALERAKDKSIIIPNEVTVRQCDIVEYDSTKDKIVLVVPYSSTHNLALVLIGSKVITLWKNSVHDTHATLDTSRYVREAI